MSQSDKPFNVSDRRHFTPEGRPREDDSPGAEAPGVDAPDPEPEPAPGPAPDAPAGPAEFSSFVVGLAAQAGALLSGEGLPEGVDARQALEGARSVVGILDMLKVKTAGNLEAPEAALLDDVLFQLRMAYVEKTRTGGA